MKTKKRPMGTSHIRKNVERSIKLPYISQLIKTSKEGRVILPAFWDGEKWDIMAVSDYYYTLGPEVTGSKYTTNVKANGSYYYDEEGRFVVEKEDYLFGLGSIIQLIRTADYADLVTKKIQEKLTEDAFKKGISVSELSEVDVIKARQSISVSVARTETEDRGFGAMFKGEAPISKLKTLTIAEGVFIPIKQSSGDMELTKAEQAKLNIPKKLAQSLVALMNTKTSTYTPPVPTGELGDEDYEILFFNFKAKGLTTTTENGKERTEVQFTPLNVTEYLDVQFPEDWITIKEICNKTINIDNVMLRSRLRSYTEAELVELVSNYIEMKKLVIDRNKETWKDYSIEELSSKTIKSLLKNDKARAKIGISKDIIMSYLNSEDLDAYTKEVESKEATLAEQATAAVVAEGVPTKHTEAETAEHVEEVTEDNVADEEDWG